MKAAKEVFTMFELMCLLKSNLPTHSFFSPATSNLENKLTDVLLDQLVRLATSEVQTDFSCLVQEMKYRQSDKQTVFVSPA